MPSLSEGPKYLRQIVELHPLQDVLRAHLVPGGDTAHPADHSLVRSVRLSVCPLHLFDKVHVFVSSWNFQEGLTLTKGQCQRLKIKVTEVKTQSSHFRTITPVQIHIWRCRKLQVAYQRCPIVFQGQLWNFKVTWDKEPSILTEICRFPDCNSSLNSPMAWKGTQSF